MACRKKIGIEIVKGREDCEEKREVEEYGPIVKKSFIKEILRKRLRVVDTVLKRRVGYPKNRDLRYTLVSTRS